MPEFDGKEAGATLQRLIFERGMNQREFANRIGVGESQLSRHWTRGMSPKTQPKTLKRLADGLGMPMAELREVLGFPPVFPIGKPKTQKQEPGPARAKPIVHHLERIEAKLEDITQRLDLALNIAEPTRDRPAVQRALSAIRPQLDRVREEEGPEALNQALATLASTDPPGPHTPEPRD